MALPSSRRGRSSTGGSSQASTGSHAFRNIAIDSPSFLELRNRGAAFVDKTIMLADLLQTDKLKRGFFSRPRKFGKSLTLDLIAKLLEVGRPPPGAEWRTNIIDVALFKGLAVHKRLCTAISDDSSSETALRNAHFVIRLDLLGATTGREVQATIKETLAEIAAEAFGSAVEAKVLRQPQPERALLALISAVPPGVPVAVLVDEYDAAILQDVEDKRWEAAKEGITAIRSLLSAAKTSNSRASTARINFFVVTGVARFARTSLFSGANNFLDLTADPDLSHVLGFSREEIAETFPNELQAMVVAAQFAGPAHPERKTSSISDVTGNALAASSSSSVGDSSAAIVSGGLVGKLEALAFWYNGYCFDGASSCFAPGPVLVALRNGVLRGAEMEGSSSFSWLGVPTSEVVELLLQRITDSGDLSVEAINIDIADLQAQRVDAMALLYQVGLLTLTPGSPAGSEIPDDFGSIIAGSYAGTEVATAPSATSGDADSAPSHSAAVGLLLRCCVPNEYARQSLRTLLAGRLTPVHASLSERVVDFISSLRHLDAAAFEAAAGSLLRAVPYLTVKAASGPDREAPFHTALWAVLFMSVPRSVAFITAEAPVQGGRADIVIFFTQKPVVWVLELGTGAGKRLSTAASSVKRKREQARRYAAAFASSSIEVVCCGIVLHKVTAASSLSASNPACVLSWARLDGSPIITRLPEQRLEPEHAAALATA